MREKAGPLAPGHNLVPVSSCSIVGTEQIQKAIVGTRLGVGGFVLDVYFATNWPKATLDKSHFEPQFPPLFWVGAVFVQLVSGHCSLVV